MRTPVISIVCGALLFCTGVQAQIKAWIDSLRAVLTGPLPDTTRIAVLYDLSWELADAGDYQEAKVRAEELQGQLQCVALQIQKRALAYSTPGTRVVTSS